MVSTFSEGIFRLPDFWLTLCIDFTNEETTSSKKLFLIHPQNQRNLCKADGRHYINFGNHWLVIFSTEILKLALLPHDEVFCSEK
jgi:hypothetical protein